MLTAVELGIPEGQRAATSRLSGLPVLLPRELGAQHPIPTFLTEKPWVATSQLFLAYQPPLRWKRELELDCSCFASLPGPSEWDS